MNKLEIVQFNPSRKRKLQPSDVALRIKNRFSLDLLTNQEKYNNHVYHMLLRRLYHLADGALGYKHFPIKLTDHTDHNGIDYVAPRFGKQALNKKESFYFAKERLEQEGFVADVSFEPETTNGKSYVLTISVTGINEEEK